MSEITIQNLTDLINVYEKEKVQQLLSTFQSRNEDVESFLINSSIKFNKENTARTYLLLETDSESTKLRGYISLLFKTIQIEEDTKVSNRSKKKMGVSPKLDSFVTLLVAQYGKNQNEKHNCDPKVLLGYALELSEDIQTRVGGLTTLLLECDSENENLRNYYEGIGFQPLQVSNDLNQYYIFINDSNNMFLPS